jgi:hypothetical protein
MSKSLRLRTITRGLKKNGARLAEHAGYVTDDGKVCATGAVAVVYLGLEKAKQVTNHPHRYVDDNFDLYGNTTRGAVAKESGVDPKRLLALEFGYEGHLQTTFDWLSKGKYAQDYKRGQKMRQMAEPHILSD